jgi:hypothetical protein
MEPKMTSPTSADSDEQPSAISYQPSANPQSKIQNPNSKINLASLASWRFNQSAIRNSKSKIPTAFTLVELLTTLALVVAILGVMVSLSRHVRSASAEDLTRDLLIKLDGLMDEYVARHEGRLPSVLPLINAPNPSESALAAPALENNRQFLLALQPLMDRSNRSFQDLSIAGYDGKTLRDAWGTPIIFMPAMHPAIGMSPKGWFFFSAGPDRQFLTRDDNIYSYERISAGGHRE